MDAVANVIVVIGRKADRPKRIPNPVTLEEKFIMYGEITKKAEKMKKSLVEKRARVAALEEELLALSRMYVKNNSELKLIDELHEFEGELYVGVNIDKKMTDDFAQKHETIRIRRNVVVLK